MRLLLLEGWICERDTDNAVLIGQMEEDAGFSQLHRWCGRTRCCISCCAARRKYKNHTTFFHVYSSSWCRFMEREIMYAVLIHFVAKMSECFMDSGVQFAFFSRFLRLHHQAARLPATRGDGACGSSMVWNEGLKRGFFWWLFRTKCS